jgi:hypothetical protein
VTLLDLIRGSASGELATAIPAIPATVETATIAKIATVAVANPEEPNPGQSTAPCPSDLAERAAIIAEGDGCERATADQRALMETGYSSWSAFAEAHARRIRDHLASLPPRADRGAHGLASATLAFLEGPWFARAVELGWALDELFGVDATAPKTRPEHHGIVPFLTWSSLRGPRLVGISADGFTVETASGSRLTSRRLAHEAARIMPWWQVPSFGDSELDPDAQKINPSKA